MKKKLLPLVLLAASVSFASAQAFQQSVPKGKAPTNTTTKNFNQVQKEKQLQSSSVQLLKKSNLENQKMQVISSTTKGNKTLQLIKDSQGRVFKSLIAPSRDKVSLRESNRMRAEASGVVSDTTFFESFEKYDGKTFDWIPDGWTDKSLVGNVPQPEYKTNITWDTTSGNLVTASDGQMMAWIQFSYAHKQETTTPGDSVMIEAKQQDEWLITPSITPTENDKLYFDLYYAPIFMYINTTPEGGITFDFSKPLATMQVQLSKDNGVTWEQIWDAHDLVDKYNEENIYDYMSGSWNTYSINLAKYKGQAIKLAFRYVGKNGDSMAIDKVSIRKPSPIALYDRPKGSFIWGLSEGFSSLKNSRLIGAAYQNCIWNNYSNSDAETFEWKLDLGEEALSVSTEFEPKTYYPDGAWKVPELKASAADKNSIYSWGGGNSILLTGGTSQVTFKGDTVPTTMGIGNYDLNYKIVNYRFGEGDYCFGTGPKNKIDAIANYFEKPVQTYVISKVWIQLANFKAPNDTEFKLIIHRVKNNGALSDTIATSVCYPSDVTEPAGVGAGYFNMPFTFKKIDPNTGREIETFLEISDAILIELSGFNNKEGVELSAFVQAETSPTYESNAYIYYLTNKNGKVTRKLFNASDYLVDGYTSLLFNLDLVYNYLHADVDKFELPVEGGSKTIKLASLYDSENVWTTEAVPSWLKIEKTFNPETWDFTLTFTAEALPKGTEGRKAIVTFASYGIETPITITQGNATGIADNKVSATKVIFNGNSFELTYGADTKSVAVYNVAGQLVASYELPANGTFVAPAADMNNGMYVFKFIGNSTETIKVIK